MECVNCSFSYTFCWYFLTKYCQGWIKITNLNHLPLGRLHLFVCVMNFQLSPVPPEHHVMKQDLLCLSLYLPCAARASCVSSSRQTLCCSCLDKRTECCNFSMCCVSIALYLLKNNNNNIPSWCMWWVTEMAEVMVCPCQNLISLWNCLTSSYTAAHMKLW